MARNWWREHVTDTYRLARMAWEADAEQATFGYPDEMREYRREHPAPVFRDFLVGLRPQSRDEYEGTQPCT